MKFEIRNRFTMAVQFTCELDASFETKSLGEQLGGAVKKANLSGANLSGADLRGADLSDADLSDADLRDIKSDILEKLLLAKNEVLGLYDCLMKGRIDGSCYEGECACFCGTIANIRHESYREMQNGLKPNADSPTERWFLNIRKGGIPQSNQVSAITAEWMREFMDKEGIKYPEYEIVAK